MPFDYYARLTRAERRIYDASDAIAVVPIADVAAAAEAASELVRALEGEDKRAAGRAAQALSDAICAAVGVDERPIVRTLAKRPSSAREELHGLYVREEGERPVIRVWMRTAAQRRVVKPRTFLRTLLHEILHHLDYALFRLKDSYHTEGFFRRESNLVRRLTGSPPRAAKPAPPAPRAPREPEQLELFGR